MVLDVPSSAPGDNVICGTQKFTVLEVIEPLFFFRGKFPGSPKAVANITLHKHINDQILDYPFVIFSQL